MEPVSEVSRVYKSTRALSRSHNHLRDLRGRRLDKAQAVKSVNLPQIDRFSIVTKAKCSKKIFTGDFF